MEREKEAVRVGTGDRTLGVIDSLGTGFEKINGMLWVILLPIVLSLFFLLGPQLSAGPAIASALSWYNSALPLEAQDVSALTGGQFSDTILSAVGGVNLFSFVAFGIGLASRGSIPALNLAPLPMASQLAIDSPLDMVAWAAGLELLGLLLGAAFLGLIGQRVRDGAFDLSRLLRKVWGYWLGMVGFVLLVAVAVVVASVPMGAVLALGFAVAPAAAEIIAAALLAGWQVAALWLALFTFFVVDALVVGELGPVAAIKSSMGMVGKCFWSALGFILLYLVITYGMITLWGQLGGELWVMAVSILGNAYISCGLAAASMVFYRSRAMAG